MGKIYSKDFRELVVQNMKCLYFSGHILYKDFNLEEYYDDKEEEFLYA
jgi:hypothetical protein